MKASINLLGHVLYAPSQYVIPVFQRNYRWERPQWERLWSSLGDLQAPGKTGNHFMGFLVFVQGGTALPGQNTRFHLIDGQQRLTTVSLLLAAIRNVARRRGDEDLAREVHEYYLVHPLRKGDARYRLLPKAVDSEAFIAIIEGKAITAGRMADALSYFESMVEAATRGVGTAPRRLFELACQRLEFMSATLESESAYNIFKSLNSTGVQLGQADLIRNFVFMHVHPDRHDEFDVERWRPLEDRFPGDSQRLDEKRFSAFFRDVLMSAGAYVQPTETFASFELRHEATHFDAFALAATLQEQADDYLVIQSARPDTDPAVTRAVAGLNALESSTTYPLLLALFTARRAGTLTSAQLAAAIDDLRGFIFRRFVCGESSRGYGQMFVRAIPAGAAADPAALRDYLLARGWPHDARFAEAFATFPFYKRGYARETLEAIEAARGHKEAASLALAQVEHVMPQSLSAAWVDEFGEDAGRIHAEWLHRIGNLALSAYNQEIGNQPFSSKRARFAQSNIGITRELGEYPHWTEAEMRERGERLAAEARALWPGPAEPHETEEVAELTEATRPLRHAFWTQFLEHLADKHPAVPLFEPTTTRRIRLRDINVRRVSVEVRYKVQEDSAALDIIFHRPALPLWEKLKAAPEALDAMIGERWLFERAPRAPYAWMTITRSVPSSDPAEWPTLHAWLGQRLEQLHEHVLPLLRAEMNEGSDDAPDDDEDEGAPRRLSATRQQQLRFWGVFADAIRARSDTVKPQKPMAARWTNLAVGRTGFFITPTLNTRRDRIGVEFFIGTTNAKSQFNALREKRAEIEAALGFPVVWEELPDRVSSRIGCWLEGAPLGDEARWEEYAAWMAERAIGFDRVLRPLVRELP